MASSNPRAKATPKHTHEGAIASYHVSPMQQLRRSVMSCFLWEKEFYEEGEEIATRIIRLCGLVPPMEVAALAIEARSQMHLRHVPLLLLAALAQLTRGTSILSDTMPQVIQRADELTEFVAVYARVNKQPLDNLTLSAQVKKGLAAAFRNFNAYSLAKYDRDGQVKLRDLLRLTHPAPATTEQSVVWKGVLDKTLESPDTWEVALSTGKAPKATWERLIKEGKLGYLALLRNLRNMEQACVDETLVRDAILARKGGADRVLPFRFLAAAKASPRFEPEVDQALLATLSQAPKLFGKTVVIVDVSGSMYGSRVSAKSDMTRADAACALGAIMREVCETPVIYATAGSDYTRKHKTQLVPARRGLALASAIQDLCAPLGGGGIFLKQVMDYIGEKETGVDRVVVITDEQDCGIGSENSPEKAKILGRRSNYILNVASAQNGIGYQKWTHINGFSESVVNYIVQSELFDDMVARRQAA